MHTNKWDKLAANKSKLEIRRFLVSGGLTLLNSLLIGAVKANNETSFNSEFNAFINGITQCSYIAESWVN